MKIKEYIDKNTDWKDPFDGMQNFIKDYRLYCQEACCNRYIKGSFEGNMGTFYSENGEDVCDTRNECWWCKTHAKRRDTLKKLEKI